MPVFITLLDQRMRLKTDLLGVIKPLIFGAVWFLAGFILGTPQVVTRFSIFLKYFSVSMFQHAGFDRGPDTPLGFIGQWSVLDESLGRAAAILFLAALIYHAYLLIKKGEYRGDKPEKREKGIGVIFVAIISLNLPMLMVYNYAARFYLPIIILVTVLAGFFVEDMYKFGNNRSSRIIEAGVIAAAFAVLGLSALRVASVTLLFFNDSRIAASAFVAEFPKYSSVEYTFFPPTIPDRYFKRKHNYPLFFSKSMMEGEPDPGWEGKVNLGEAGLQKRGTDYLIIDSPTYERFDDPITCASIPVECEFFKRLRSGETGYRLEKVFEYRLPTFLPQIFPFFLNPRIEIYHAIS
jgi:hypothetical protein